MRRNANVVFGVGAVVVLTAFVTVTTAKYARADRTEIVLTATATAETDPARRVRVDLELAAPPAKIADGPFVVTGMGYPIYDNGGAIVALYTVPQGAPCGNWDPRSQFPDAPGPVIARILGGHITTTATPVAAQNITVRGDETLCGVNAGSFSGIVQSSVASISGYRPY
jgi:hypothetical protein